MTSLRIAVSKQVRQTIVCNFGLFMFSTQTNVVHMNAYGSQYKQIYTTRSLGALRALTSSWRPSGPLDFVLRALRALRPRDTVSPGGNKPMCVFYHTCVEKKTPASVGFPTHVCFFFHTYMCN